MPSCNKLAASHLMRDCTTLDTYEADGQIHNLKKLYAARLAVCELHEAKVHLPQACLWCLPIAKPRRRSFWTRDEDVLDLTNPTLTYTERSEADLDKCLSALHEDGSGQGWTSYSINNKNAVALCHAVRGEIEKDEHIHMFKVFLNSTVPIAAALSRSRHEWEEARKMFHELMKSSRAFLVDLQGQHVAQRDAVTKLWDEAQSEADRRIAALLHGMTELDDRLAGSLAYVQNAHVHLRNDLDQTHHAVKTAQMEHQQSVMVTSKYIRNVQEGVENLSQDIQHKIQSTIADVSSALVANGKTVDMQHTSLQNLRQALDEHVSQQAATIANLAEMRQLQWHAHEQTLQMHHELQSAINATQLSLERAAGIVMDSVQTILEWNYGDVLQDAALLVLSWVILLLLVRAALDKTDVMPRSLTRILAAICSACKCISIAAEYRTSSNMDTGLVRMISIGLGQFCADRRIVYTPRLTFMSVCGLVLVIMSVVGLMQWSLGRAMQNSCDFEARPLIVGNGAQYLFRHPINDPKRWMKGRM